MSNRHRRKAIWIMILWTLGAGAVPALLWHVVLPAANWIKEVFGPVGILTVICAFLGFVIGLGNSRVARELAKWE